MMSLLIIHEILALALLYSCFCRAVKTGETTRPDVLVVFWLLGVASVVNVFAPIVWPKWAPDAASLSLLAATLLVQLVMAKDWRHGVPHQLKKAEK